MRKQHVATIREEGTSLLEVCCFHKALGAHCSPLNDVMGMHCATDVLHYQMMPILYHLGVRVLNGIVFIFLRGPPPLCPLEMPPIALNPVAIYCKHSISAVGMT